MESLSVPFSTTQSGDYAEHLDTTLNLGPNTHYAQLSFIQTDIYNLM